MIKLLRTRRTIRKYQNKSIEPKKLNLLKEAILHSPSGNHINPWHFYFIQNKNLISVLSKSKPNSEFIEKAPLLVVITAGKDISTTWIEDCSIAAILLQLQAHDLQLGSCWIQIRDRFHNAEISSETYIQNILNLPENTQIEAIISVGYPAEKKQSRDIKSLNWNKIADV